MKNQISLKQVLDNLIKYIKREEYRGYDPYDLLNSPLFKLPILRSNKLIRFYSQQVFRRIPFNLRPLLGIRKEVNPVTLGLAIQAYTYLIKANYPNSEELCNEIKYMIDKLNELKSDGYSGYCWGYNFDWEARYVRIPKYCPTVVATGIITNGLYEYWKFSKDKRVEEILISSANYVLNDLNRSYEGDTFCFSYSPNDYQKVYNATMKGARLLAQVYSITKNKNLILEAEKTVRFVINNQNEDGSWYYSKGDARKWVDNFHTAYVLDCMKSFIQISGKEIYNIHLEKGIKFYLNNLFTNEYCPKYYSHSLLPVDATEVAQSIFTLSNFNFINEALSVFDYGIKKLYKNGYIKYQIRRFYKIQIPYMRWAVSYWFNSLSFLYNKI